MALTSEQLQAIGLPGSVILTASAGSGKTSVLSHRYLSLVKKGISPRRILAVTFTTDAAWELRSRIARLSESALDLKSLSAIATTPNIGTIHSLCYRILDTYGSVIGLPPIQSILQQPHWLKIRGDAISTWLKSLPESDLALLETHIGFNNLPELIDTFSEGALPQVESPIWCQFLKFFQPLLEDLRTRVRNLGLYSFDELELFSERILIESEHSRTKMIHQFDAILVDEFQDTSRRQYRILNCLRRPSTNMFYVGDPKQSIYRFRHADVNLFKETVDSLRDSAALLLSLNFRTHQTLIDDFNRFAKEFFPDSPLMVSGKEGLGSSVCIRTFESGTTRAEALENELCQIHNRAQELINAGVSPSDIAILSRSALIIPALYERLRKSGIPTSSYTLNPLFSSYTVVDIDCFLRAVLNPLDDIYMAGLLRGPAVLLTLKELWDLSQHNGDSLFEKLTLNPLAPAKWFIDLIEQSHGELSDVLPYFISRLKAHDAGALHYLIQSLFEQCRTTAEAVELLTLWKKGDLHYGASRPNDNAIRLSTVHGVKGLEFKHVFIVDMARQPPTQSPLFAHQTIPVYKTRIDNDWECSRGYTEYIESERALDDEESKRIFYVAITRAQESLTLFVPLSDKVPKRSWASLCMPVIKELTQQQK